jgi:hypothetical protein
MATNLSSSPVRDDAVRAEIVTALDNGDKSTGRGKLASIVTSHDEVGTKQSLVNRYALLLSPLNQLRKITGFKPQINVGKSPVQFLTVRIDDTSGDKYPHIRTSLFQALQ